MGGLHQMIDRHLASSSPDHPAPAKQIHAILRSSGVEDADTSARDQIVSLLVAGHDTVASALSWTLFWLIKNPALINMLREEQVKSGNTLEDSPLLEAVCHEALRLVPTVEIVSREATQDISVGEYIIPRGTLVSPCVYLLHRNAKLYPQPAEFVPTRFMDRQFALHEFIPFGGGLRRCLGANLGLLEMKRVLSTLLLNFDFVTDRIENVQPQRRNVTIAPSPGFRVRFKRR